ncbi:MAG TPA: MaoC/PaaZ C-terminal domain-containing protein [Chloroflexota bacterium]|nr:MaoC/PaaZ C-terminal domain-containing protein [Chloroflexota bacterium]
MGLFFEEFEEGKEYVTRARTITEADVVAFAGVSGDFNPLHTDAELMKASEFGERIAHGMLVSSIGTGLSSQMGWFEGTTVALLEVTFRFKGPVKFGDTVRLVITVKEKKPTRKPDRGVLIVEANVLNQRDETVIEGQWTTMMRRRPSSTG